MRSYWFWFSPFSLLPSRTKWRNKLREKVGWCVPELTDLSLSLVLTLSERYTAGLLQVSQSPLKKYYLRTKNEVKIRHSYRGNRFTFSLRELCSLSQRCLAPESSESFSAVKVASVCRRLWEWAADSSLLKASNSFLQHTSTYTGTWVKTLS